MELIVVLSVVEYGCGVGMLGLEKGMFSPPAHAHAALHITLLSNTPSPPSSLPTFPNYINQVRERET
ncbi:hypothetical protein J5N97_024190 [Dioscorea zingiberensis]|uniref:Uncharacterized protein n=1 Tax=Dioscorea zingiberensis TaxID=325984 RepID=A0A9D5C6S6_9LILI|nr:hypothetical protein J5N97_024190 [Dioscorea zingiberensis]